MPIQHQEKSLRLIQDRATVTHGSQLFLIKLLSLQTSLQKFRLDGNKLYIAFPTLSSDSLLAG